MATSDIKSKSNNALDEILEGDIAKTRPVSDIKSKTTSDIESRVINVTAQVLNVDPGKITLDSSYTNDLGADSLDTVELMMAIEAEFQDNNLNIPDEDAAKISTVRDTVNYIAKRKSEE